MMLKNQASTKLKLKKWLLKNSLGKTNLVNKQIEPIDKPLRKKVAFLLPLLMVEH